MQMKISLKFEVLQIYSQLLDGEREIIPAVRKTY